MREKLIGVIGNGKMALDCINFMLKYEEAKVKFWILDPHKANPSETILAKVKEAGVDVKGIQNINSIEAFNFIKQYQPDIIFSINNYKIIKGRLTQYSTNRNN